MKIEVQCSGCNGGYLMDIDTLAAGVPCPECGRVLDASAEAAAVDVPHGAGEAPAAGERQEAAATVDTQEVPLSGDTRETAAVSSATAAAVATEPTAPRATSGSAEVVCPRCQLHFKPRSGTAAQESNDRLTILVVEDMEYFREIAADALSGEYEVCGVATKDAARAELDRRKVDLMVLDLTLDGGEAGLDLLRELSSKPCPILIYTAQDESEMYGDSWEELKQLGADDIVIKGMNVGDELVRKVGTLLGRDWGDDE